MSTTTTPRLSVIIPTFNPTDTIGAAVRSAVDQPWGETDWELIIVDDSTDPVAAERVSRLADDTGAIVVSSGPRRNLARARNVGVEHSRGEFVCFLDDDDLLSERWWPALEAAIASHDVVAFRLDLSRLNDPATASVRSPSQVSGLDRAYGAPLLCGAIALRRELYVSVGGNDENLPAGEDTDFSIRLFRRHGIEPFLATDAVYHYRLRDSARDLFRVGRRYGRIGPQLHRRYASQGDQPVVDRYLREWLWILASVLRLRNERRRLRWAYRFGVRLGRLEGSLATRTWCP